MSASPIRVGIIGLSANRGWASDAHLPSLRALSDQYEVTALSASSDESAKAAGEKYGIANAYGSAEDLVNDPNVDLVVVAVKVPEHDRLVRAALNAGKHVYCEWPLGKNEQEAIALDALAKEKGLRGVIGLQTRGSPVVQYVRDLIRDGYIGDVLSTTMIGSGGGWGPVIDEPNAYLNDITHGATMVSIPFGHAVDALAFALGDWADAKALMAIRRPTVTVVPTNRQIDKTAPDQLVVTGTLESGAVAAIHYRGGMAKATNFHWEINGSAGDLLITAPTGHLQNGSPALQGAQGTGTLEALEVPASYFVAPQEVAGRPYNVAQIYAQLASDIASGENTLADFSHAAKHHAFIDGLFRDAGFPVA